MDSRHGASTTGRAERTAPGDGFRLGGRNDRVVGIEPRGERGLGPETAESEGVG